MPALGGGLRRRRLHLHQGGAGLRGRCAAGHRQPPDHARHRRARRDRRVPRRAPFRAPAAADAEVLACSSAGGGLRIAVVGNEELVTAEAGRRVALSSGGKVVAVLGRASSEAAFLDLVAESRPDVVLLTGGTDGGDEEGILLGAQRLASSGWRGPVVVAGNVAARSAVAVPAGGLAGRGHGQRGAADRRTHSRAGAPRHPRDVPRARDRRQGSQLARRLHRDGARCDARPRAHRGRGARGGDGGRRRGGRHRGSDDRRALRRTTRSGGRRPVARGRRHDAGDAHGRGRPRHALERAQHLGGGAAAAEDLRAAADSVPRPVLPPDHSLPNATRTSRSPRPRPRSRCAATPAGRMWWWARTAASWSAPARTCARWPCSWARVACSGTRPIPDRILDALTGVSPEGWQLPERPRVVVDRDYVLAAVGLLSERRPAAASALARSLTTCEETPGS